MKSKKCFKCGEVKPLSEFYKHPRMADGRVNKCKECNKKDVSINYRKKINYYKAYEKKRNAKRWEYKTEEAMAWRKRNPDKYKAHKKLHNALRGGKIKKQPCFICGSKDVHGHHYDYSKPLNVIWLCAQHHQWMHRKKTYY